MKAEGTCAPAGSAPPGQGCGKDADCTTLLCDQGACRQPCLGDAACPATQSCNAKVGEVAVCAVDAEPADAVDGADSAAATTDANAAAKPSPPPSAGCHSSSPAPPGSVSLLMLALMVAICARRRTANQ